MPEKAKVASKNLLNEHIGERNVTILSFITVVACAYIYYILHESNAKINMDVSLETAYLMRLAILTSIPVWLHFAWNVWEIIKHNDKVTFTDIKALIILSFACSGLFLPILVHQAVYVVTNCSYGMELMQFLYYVHPIFIAYSLSLAIVRSKHKHTSRNIYTVALSFVLVCFSCIEYIEGLSITRGSYSTTAAGCIYLSMAIAAIESTFNQLERQLRDDEIIVLICVPLFVIGNLYHIYSCNGTASAESSYRCMSNVAIACSVTTHVFNQTQSKLIIANNYETLNELVLIEALSKELEKEREKKIVLLHQLLPPKVASKLLGGEKIIPELFDQATVFFSDIEGFTKIATAVEPLSLVHFLNDMYSVMDHIASLFKLYKVETIGDAYVIASGVPEAWIDNAAEIANFALVVHEVIKLVINPATNTSVRIRIGINSGPVMGGVVGVKMPRYCLFGDTMNTASRMESTGQVDKIHVSESTACVLQEKYPGWFQLEKREHIEVKGKGKMTTYWLSGYDTKNPKLDQQFMDRTREDCSKLLQELQESNPGYTKFTNILGSLSRSVSLDDLCKSPHSSVDTPDTKVMHKMQISLSDATATDPVTVTKKRVALLIDDSVVSLRMTAAKLEADGYDVITAHNGNEALQKYNDMIKANTDISLIIMDDDMPIMNGRITSLMLRNAGYEGYIIGLTGKITREFKQEVTFCFPKPLSIDTLKKVLK